MDTVKNSAVPFDWNAVSDRSVWLEPCEESYYYAEKWRREGRKSVLDLGCGLGRHSVLFAERGFKVTASDISDDALSFLKKYSRDKGINISCRKADMDKLPFSDDAFDCVFAMHSAGHSDTAGTERVMNEIKRVLKPGGSVFMTLCSKESPTFCDESLPRIDANTVLKTEGPEQGVPHFFADHEDIKRLFAGFELIKVRLIDDCCGGGKWSCAKHYFIEAAVQKEPAVLDFSDTIGREVRCLIDRPLGSAHPRHPDLIYGVNYGYIEGIIAGDGAEQDVYIIGEKEPLREFTGRVVGVYHRFNDNEDKWIVAPNGYIFSEEEILRDIDFQERFFDGELYL